MKVIPGSVYWPPRYGGTLGSNRRTHLLGERRIHLLGEGIFHYGGPRVTFKGANTQRLGRVLEKSTNSPHWMPLYNLICPYDTGELKKSDSIEGLNIGKVLFKSLYSSGGKVSTTRDADTAGNNKDKAGCYL